MRGLVVCDYSFELRKLVNELLIDATVPFITIEITHRHVVQQSGRQNAIVIEPVTHEFCGHE